MARTQQVLIETHETLHTIHEQLRSEQKRAYDKRRNPDELEEGDQVLVYYPPSLTKKLCYLWRGPYEVAEKHSPVSYTLKSILTGQKDKARTNINRMAKYHPRHDAFLSKHVEKKGEAGAVDDPTNGPTNSPTNSRDKKPTSTTTPTTKQTPVEIGETEKFEPNCGGEPAPEVLTPNGFAPAEIQTGLFVIVEINLSEYDATPPISSTTKPPKQSSRQTRAKGRSRENPRICWRLAEIIDVLEATPTDPLKFNVRYWETYDVDKDLRERVYAPAYWNAQQQEQYTARYIGHTPKTWEEMRDTLEPRQVMLPKSFKLSAKRTLPREVCQELIPLISIHVVALPLHQDQQKGPLRPFRGTE